MGVRDVCAGWVCGVGVPDGETSIRRLIEGPDRSKWLKRRTVARDRSEGLWCGIRAIDGCVFNPMR